MIKKLVCALCTACLLCGVATMSSCSNENDKLTNRQLFEKYKPLNIKVFVQTIKMTHQKMDEATAAIYADSLMEFLYRTDSTFMRMDQDDHQKFLDQNRYAAVAHCDSIFSITR